MILILLSAIVVVIAASIANRQTTSDAKAQEEAAVAMNTAPNNGRKRACVYGLPWHKDPNEALKRLGPNWISSQRARARIFWTYSERESAQIYYDSAGKVTAISIDYLGENSNAPTPYAVLGAAIQAKPDGSMYQLNRYPEAGYWVSYNRTAGDKPIVTITIRERERAPSCATAGALANL